jgi:hypothetical protein
MSLLSRKQKEETLYVATETVLSRELLRPWISRGEVVPRSDPRVRAHPDAFKPAPKNVWRGPSPRPNEAVAISKAMFIASDNKYVMPGTRLHPYDGLVRAHPQYFYLEAPRD